MAIHRVRFTPVAARSDLAPGHTLEIEGEEAKHALRTKRLGEGDPVELLTGQGLVASARITAITRRARSGGRGGRDWVMSLGVERVHTEARTLPQMHVRSGVPKGARLEALIEGISQAGGASWGALETRRSVVDPRPGKLVRMERVAAEASKQCGRAWVLDIQASRTLDEVLEAAEGGLIIADPSGPVYQPTGAESLTLLIGPEGGFETDEIDRAVSAGARTASFGPHTMRVETACTVACGIVLDVERRHRSRDLD